MRSLHVTRARSTLLARVCFGSLGPEIWGGLCLSVLGGEPEVRITAAFPNTGSCFNSNDFGYLGFLDVVCATKFVSIDRWFPRFFFEFSPGKNDPIGRSSQAHIFFKWVAQKPPISYPIFVIPHWFSFFFF